MEKSFKLLRSPIFSTQPGGSKNPNIEQTVIINVGKIKLNEKKRVRLLKYSVTISTE
jgi:hypothetical protein